MVEVKDMRQLFELALKIETAVAGGAAANAGPWDQMRALTGPSGRVRPEDSAARQQLARRRSDLAAGRGAGRR